MTNLAINYDNFNKNISVVNFAPGNKDLPPICTIKEIAQFFGISESEARKLDEAGYIKKLRGSNSPKKFSKTSVMNWYHGK